LPNYPELDEAPEHNGKIPPEMDNPTMMAGHNKQIEDGRSAPHMEISPNLIESTVLSNGKEMPLMHKVDPKLD
jgi:hypothetical protein